MRERERERDRERERWGGRGGKGEGGREGGREGVHDETEKETAYLERVSDTSTHNTSPAPLSLLYRSILCEFPGHTLAQYPLTSITALKQQSHKAKILKSQHARDFLMMTVCCKGLRV